MRLWLLLDAAAIFLGIVAIVAGVAQVSRPAAWIIAGLASLAIGLWPPRRR
jgi:uncharacterized membrane-anchored protein